MAVSLAVWFDRQVTVNRVIKIALAALEEAEEAVEIVRGYNKEENWNGYLMPPDKIKLQCVQDKGANKRWFDEP